MKRISPVLAAGLLALLVFSLPVAAKDASNLEKRAANWTKAYNAGKLGDVAALYTKDAMRLPPNAEALKGRKELQTGLRRNLDMGAAKVDIRVKESHTEGGLAWGRGTFAIMTAAGEVVDRGKWMNVSVMVDGQWLIHRDIWNSDLPLPGAAPPRAGEEEDD